MLKRHVLACVLLVFNLCLLRSPAMGQERQVGPQPGHILIRGMAMGSIHNNYFVVRVTEVILPAGQVVTLHPSRLKPIRMNALTTFEGIGKNGLTSGLSVVIEGKDAGVGKPLAASTVRAWRAAGAVQSKTFLQSPELRGSDLQQSELQQRIDDYNDLLTRAQEANHDWRAASKAEDETIKRMARSQPEDMDHLHQDARVHLGEVEAGIVKERDCLRQAISLRLSIVSAPRFRELYHETHLCLPPKEVVEDQAGDRQAAESLRFIEKR